MKITIFLIYIYIVFVMMVTYSVENAVNVSVVNNTPAGVFTEKQELRLISEGMVTKLSYIDNTLAQPIPVPVLNTNTETYVDTLVFNLDGVPTNLKNPNPWRGKFCEVWNSSGHLTTLIQNNTHYYIYILNNKILVFSEVEFMDAIK
jgi:hypothetical protein